MTKSSEEREQLSTWTVHALWWIEYLWNKLLTRVALWCVALMTGTYKPKVIKGWTPDSAQIDRAQHWPPSTSSSTTVQIGTEGTL